MPSLTVLQKIVRPYTCKLKCEQVQVTAKLSDSPTLLNSQWRKEDPGWGASVRGGIRDTVLE